MSRSTSLRRLCLCRPTSSSSMLPPLELHLTSLYSKRLLMLLVLIPNNLNSPCPNKMVLRTVLPRLVLLQSDPPVMSPLNSNTHLLACIPYALARSFHKHKRVFSVLHMRVCQSLGQNSAKILNVTIRTHVLQDPRQQKTGCQPRRELEHVSFLQKLFCVRPHRSPSTHCTTDSEDGKPSVTVLDALHLPKHHSCGVLMQG